MTSTSTTIAGVTGAAHALTRPAATLLCAAGHHTRTRHAIGAVHPHTAAPELRAVAVITRRLPLQ